MNNQLVVYGASRGLAVLPNAVRTAVSGMQTAAQIIAYVKKTAWYLSKANSARKQILASLSGGGSRSTIREIAPVTINTKIKPRAARVRPGKIAGAMRITHREYLGEIAGNTTFGCTGYKINPGLGGVFPWLSGIANNFEKYKINSMSLQFVSISATSERGRITLACDYDVLDELPANKVDLFQVAGAVESSIWSSERLTVKPSGVLFTRGGPVSNSDLKTYDQGQLLIGVSNTANTNVIGEAFLEYDIELMIPQPAQCPSWTFSAGGGSFTNVAIAGNAVYALALTTPSPSTGLIIEGALNVIPTSSNTLTFPLPGKYIVSGCIDIVSGTLAGLTNTGTATLVNWGTTVDNSRTSWMTTVTVTAPNQTYTTNFTGSGTGSITVLVSHSSAPTLLGV